MKCTSRPARSSRRVITDLGGATLLASSLLIAGSQVALAATPRSSPPPPPALGKVIHLLQAETHATFTASYVMTGSSGHSVRFTVHHRGTDERVDLPSHEVVLVLGTTGYLCTQATPHPTCLKQANSYLIDAAASLVTPQILVTDLLPIEKRLLNGMSVSTSTRTVAGQHALCVVITHKGTRTTPPQVLTYCVTPKVLAYVGTGAGVVRLTHFASFAPASLFALPKGAVVSSTP